MAKDKLNKEGKAAELKKYRDLVLATMDYYLDNKLMQIKTADFDSDEHFKSLKIHAEEHFKKGRLTMLKQWFRDFTEMQLETGDLHFNKYLQDKTNYDVDIFKSYFKRIDKIIEKGKITSDNQFYDINIMVDKLCQIEPVDNKKIEILNNLLGDYKKRKPLHIKREVEIAEFAFEDVDDVPLPPENLISKFKTLQDWLFDICDNDKLQKAIAKYELGLFESINENTLFLVGVNTYDEENRFITRIEFEPSNMYFKLPKNQFGDLSREQLLDKLVFYLKDFVNSEKFKASFLSRANSIVFTTNGQTIWSK